MAENTPRIELHDSISTIAEATWDSCANPSAGLPDDPFTTHRFLKALEDSGSVGSGTGWHPLPISVHLGDEMIACAPLYVKYHSQGEYIFDHNFADAYERAGGDYYPKLQVAVPFTPVTGRRLLTAPGFDSIGQAALLQGIAKLTRNNGLSSAHVTFCTTAETKAATPHGFLPRLSQQYHWRNDDYGSFDDFLNALSSRKRKAIRKERLTAQTFGGRIYMRPGADLTDADWDAMWRFYQDTGARKWGSPYLTRAFFDIARDVLADDVVMALAYDGATPIAGALNFQGRDRLFGRYWGCNQHHPCLHFELCYYQAIDWAIAHGLRAVEAGAQGDHKLARGYLPTATHSLHYFTQAGFSDAVAQYLRAERKAASDDIAVLTEYGPFRATRPDEQP